MKKSILQGDRVEHPIYIKKQNLKPDYSFYITNQIMKPVTQIFNLSLEQMSKFNNKTTQSKYKKDLKIIEEKYNTSEKISEKTTVLRDKMVKKIIFDDSLRTSDNAKKGQRSISSFFQAK